MDAPAAFRIERPGLRDTDALARVHVQGWKEAYGHLLPPSFYGDAALTARRRFWESVLSDAEAGDRVRVARSADEIIGFALIGPSRDQPPPRDVQLYALYVLADRYGTGAGQSLIDALLGSRPASLWVAKDNGRARRFYEKNGFTPDGMEKIDPDVDGLAEVRMIR